MEEDYTHRKVNTELLIFKHLMNKFKIKRENLVNKFGLNNNCEKDSTYSIREPKNSSFRVKK
jgi:hypothetical protein